MSINLSRSETKIEQLTIWTLLDRVSAAPEDANIIDLSNWIGSLDLEPAGDALVTWADCYRDRAIKLLDEWQQQPSLFVGELVEPPYDRTIFDELVLGRMEWDLGDLVETVETDYPTTRQAAPAIALVSKDAALKLADFRSALDIAHEEKIEEWVQTTIDAIESGVTNFADLAELLPIGQILLSVLLSGDRIRLTRSHGGFYDIDGLVFLKIG
ncbi:hypothetical protein [Chamaesiphon polymorphus]|uniref:Uncharacterized protein n=1 Tax=Chamaesiphon polymorphus CCALA 037 TaxID=2107692 RepID=A0A2T1F857_9CYAN|nr:hypothetical protein [Chamaesiphon polymorphus]PSB41200.1 hypothetical protein C7B77_27615 [Chamaesiphon polymorphus CCALA 037]